MLEEHKKNASKETTPALIANQDEEDDPFVCLMTKYETHNEPEKTNDWYIDSGCSNHMTYDKINFLPIHQANILLWNWGTETSHKYKGEET